jgi:hypothetical protein
MNHNKKRNTAFLYEALVRELTKAVVIEKNEEKQKTIKGMLRHYFHPDKPLGMELQLYKALLDENVEKQYADKYVFEVKNEHSKINLDELDKEQTRLINEINKKLSPNVFSNFVGNYKNLATIAQIFSKKTPIKEKILLEEKVITDMTSRKEQQSQPEIDNLVYKSMVKRFNQQYNESLTKEQKELLFHYISSDQDDGVALKLFLNEEIERLKANLTILKESDHFKQNQILVENGNRIMNYLSDFSKQEINEECLKKILKIQELVKEVTGDDQNNNKT